jgi:head-tail adaptor
MIVVRPGELEHQVRLERRVAGSGFDDAGADTWELVDDQLWIGIRDQLPSRTDQASGGSPTSTRRARVRLYWRDDIAPGMRLVLGDRVMHIVGEAAELGRRSGLELMVEDYRPGGNAA